MFEQVLNRCLTGLVPERLQHDPIVFVRTAVVQLLPPAYILAIWVAFYDSPRVLPPWWILALYISFPVLVRVFSSYRLPAWLFISMQYATSLFVMLQVLPSAAAYVTTAFFVPFIALVLLGRRAGLACAALSVAMVCAGHIVWSRVIPQPDQPILIHMAIVRRGMARNWVMTVLAAILHRGLAFAVDRRCRDIARVNEQMFASVWCVGASVCFSWF
jgi:hypothetical protein